MLAADTKVVTFPQMEKPDNKQVLMDGPRQAGVCLHLPSLPGTFGIGEIGREARRFIDTLRELGLSTWQFLPLGPTAYGDSPYQPLSTFAGNEMLIDVADLVERGLLSKGEVESLQGLPAGYVDYGSLIPRKWPLLALAAERFPLRANSHMKARFDAFVDRYDVLWLHEYALFRVLKARHSQRAWTEWQPEFVHHDDGALKKLEAEAAAEIQRYKVLQFLFMTQWQKLQRYARERAITLFGDMPIYIALDSADAWANPEVLQIRRDGRPDAVAGVPPDYFSADGQLWGNPVYDWAAQAASGYRWWIQRLSGAIEQMDIVRIDHFRGFEAYWAVPADADTARDGAWIPGPGSAIFEAMESELGTLPIVAEDLGVITPAVEALRDQHNMPGMRVLQFDVMDASFHPDNIVENAVCYTGTHDNDTTLGWFRGSPDGRRTPDEIRATQEAALAASRGSPATISMDFVRLAMQTPARLAIAPMQDFLGLGSDARLNTPGTSSNNWRWRFRDEQLTNERRDTIVDAVQRGGREPGTPGQSARAGAGH